MKHIKNQKSITQKEKIIKQKAKPMTEQDYVNSEIEELLFIQENLKREDTQTVSFLEYELTEFCI